ncbi:MAG: ferritin-like domain-containing protein [Nocardioides sp.]|nr:ferritin-like domain-containing protein [Nocardioides sp.]
MTVLDALQSTLAGEHAALYTYGVLGARTSQTASPTLHATLDIAYRRHRARRDQLRLMVEDAGATPVPAEPAYELDGRLLQPPAIEAAAWGIEEAGTLVLMALVARSAATVREWALTEAIWSAGWSLELGGTPQTWPGAPELT